MKLRKLRDHIENLCVREQQNNRYNKDEHYLFILCEYLTETLCNFNFNLDFTKSNKNSLIRLKYLEENIKVIRF